MLVIATLVLRVTLLCHRFSNSPLSLFFPQPLPYQIFIELKQTQRPA